MIRADHFTSPVYSEEKPEWVTQLNELCNPYISDAIDGQKQVLTDREKLGYKNDIGLSYHSSPLEPDERFRFFHDYMAKKSRWVLEDMGYDIVSYILKVGYKNFHIIAQVIIGFILIVIIIYQVFIF